MISVAGGEGGLPPHRVRLVVPSDAGGACRRQQAGQTHIIATTILSVGSHRFMIFLPSPLYKVVFHLQYTQDDSATRAGRSLAVPPFVSPRGGPPMGEAVANLPGSPAWRVGPEMDAEPVPDPAQNHAEVRRM